MSGPLGEYGPRLAMGLGLLLAEEDDLEIEAVRRCRALLKGAVT